MTPPADALGAEIRAALGDAYVVERELGGGGMSRLFLATERALERRVVVKVLPPEYASRVSEARFRREMAVAAQLQQHPNILPVLGAGTRGELLWYTMPFIEGESLRARLAREGRLAVRDALRILADAADALAYAHAQGVVHRDIKPENILLGPGGRALVADFGIAKALGAGRSGGGAGDGLTATGSSLGTPGYMAPEQIAGGGEPDPRTDVYALGVVAYEMLAGRPPFTGPTPQAVAAAHLTARPAPLTGARPDAPPGVAAAIMRALAKDPADRFASAAELREALETAGAAVTPAEAPHVATTARELGGPGVRWRRWRLAVGGAAGLALVALAAATLLRPGPERAADGGAPDMVAVIPFRVGGADPSLGYLREGLVDLLAAKLTGEAGVRAADSRAVVNAWRRAGGGDAADVTPEAQAAIASRLGAGRVLTGEVVGTPARISIAATLRDVSGGATARAAVDGPADSLPQLVDALAARLLSIGAGEAAERLPVLSRTPLPALRAYLTAQSLYRRGRFVEAVAAYESALRVDSSFVVAALGLLYADVWTGQARATLLRRARQHVWPLRDRLGPVDRLRLEAIVGSRTPAVTPMTELVASAERWVEAAPESPEAWFWLGDRLFHQGPLLGDSDALSRARTAFARARALDSAFAPALEHAPTLARLEGDTAEVRRATRLILALEPESERAAFVRWYAAAALGDTAAMRAIRPESIPARSRGLILTYAAGEGLAPDDAERFAAHTASLRPPTREQRTTQAGNLSLWMAVRGRPAEAARLLAEAATHDPRRRPHFMPLAMNAGGDPEAARRAAAEIHPDLARQPPDSAPAVAEWLERMQYLGVWEASEGHAEVVERVLELQRAHAPRAGIEGEARARLWVLILDAQLAALRRRPDAGAALARLDSVARTVPVQHEGSMGTANIVAAQLWERAGDIPRALAAIRRRDFLMSIQSRLPLALAEEGRLAALAGDREGAIRAYRHYLALRSNPEPSMRAAVAHVRAELARLEREGAGR